jgi:hypothetical protein
VTVPGASPARAGIRSLVAAFALLLGAALTADAQQPPPGAGLSENPIVRDIFTADPAALVHDGRMYIFAGRDEAPPTHADFLMREWHVYSSAAPTNDPAAWEHHGALLSIADFEWADANAWAAEVVQGPDGRFYWYVSVRWADAAPDMDRMSVGVAVADHPLGSWRDALGAPLITALLPNASAHNIDPTVLVDPEHGIYLYWGSFWSPRYVRLSENMIKLDGEIETPEGLREFWEAPWLFERDGLYYNAYASNANIGDDGCVTSSRFACIRYATAEHPAGPWTHRGIVLGQVSSTTNHPAIVEFPVDSDEWWMVYHTADLPDGGTFRRSVAIDRLRFDAHGAMELVQQTRYMPPEREPEPTRNAARTAVVTCSFTSAWEECGALNNGQDPASSDIPGPGLGTRWGTWPEMGPQWIQYQWERPVRLEASAIFWFQDTPDGTTGGVKRPAEWTIEYREGRRWVTVPDASGFGTDLNRYNRTTFSPITTTRLRATLTPRDDAAGVGALQWRVYTAEPVGVDPVQVTTQVGAEPTLPETVRLHFPEGEPIEARVWWQPYDPERLRQPGTFRLSGIVENAVFQAEATVVVRR